MQFSTTARTAILLVTLLAALAVPVWAAPGAVRLIAPEGDVTGSTVVFSWQYAPGATWYLFWIGSDTEVVMYEWYTAQSAGCADGGTCAIHATLGFHPGSYNWLIRTLDGTGYGPWSAVKTISFKELTPTWSRKLPDNRRFTLVLDSQAVLDNETGLTWERQPSFEAFHWSSAVAACMSLSRGNRAGWRLPSVTELLTLTDATQIPALPPGHPFLLGFPLPFWTQTNTVDSAYILIVDMNSKMIERGDNTINVSRAWCVRGGGNDRFQ